MCMYKDVKKKLLSVALCICMIIGAVQVVPRAKAAASLNGGYYEINIAYKTGGGGSEKVKVKINGDASLTYKGSAYNPTVADVLDSNGNSIKGKFQDTLRIISGDNKNVGSFKAVIEPTAESEYATINDPNTNECIEFTISPAEIIDMQVEAEGGTRPLLKYQGTDVYPSIAAVNVTTTNDADIKLDSSEYVVSGISEIGLEKPSTVTLKDNANFSNANSWNRTIDCDVAYDMSENQSFVKLDSSSTTLTYEGADQKSSVKLNLFDQLGASVLEGANVGTDQLSFVFKKSGTVVTEVKEVGEYTLEVTPRGGENKKASFNNGKALFTGKFSTTFTVGLKTGTVVVKAYDADRGTMEELPSDTSSYTYRVALDNSKPDGTYPTDMLVTVDGSELTRDKYDIRCVNSQGVEEKPTKAGLYTLYISPKPFTNYTGQAVVTYYVYTDLLIDKIRFADATGNVHSLNYTGSGRAVEELVVKDESGNTLAKDRDYEVQYWYDDNGWKKADNYNSAGMETVGDKQIRIVGKNTYLGKSVAWDYTIAKVHMSQSSEASHFALDIVGSTTHDYTGEPITPAYSFTYYGEPVNSDYYETVWENNMNAGVATLTVKATNEGPFEGSKSVNFTIRALSLTNAEFIGDGVAADKSKYSYTGEAIVPKLQIGTYILKEGTDYTVSYRDSGGNALAEIPSARGSYKLSLTAGGSGNIVGSVNKRYEIIQRDITNDIGASFYLNGGTTLEWNGGTMEPEVICGSLSMQKGTDYTVQYSDNTAPTSTVSASAIVTGIGNFSGTKTLYFEISKRQIGNVNIEVIPRVTGSALAYNVTFTVKDNGIAANKTLIDGVDYEITSVVYETEDDYTGLTKADLTNLQRAGIYKITIAGKKDYEGSREVEVSCGINLADADITLGAGSFSYNGEPQYPSITVSMNDVNLATFRKGDDEDTSAFRPFFTRPKEEKIPTGFENIYAGTVNVKAVGNTKQGYYGMTASESYRINPLDISYAKTLYKVDLSNDPNRLRVDGGKVYYQFTNRSVKPQEEVKKADGNTAVSAPAILAKEDYTVSYGDDCIRKGAHQIYVRGVGNFTGEIGCTFYIDAMGIDDPAIEFVPDKVDTYAEGVPTFKLMLNGAVPLENGKDYTFNYTRKDSGSAGWLDTYEFKITGMDNFANSTPRIERIKVNPTTLKKAVDLTNPQVEEVYISSWNYDELMVSPGAVSLAKPSRFVLTYKRKDGTTYNLHSENDEDFEVTNFVPTMKPGEGSTMDIKGKGGFNSEVTFDVPLYTNIEEADFLKDAEGKNASVLSPNGSVSIDVLQEAIEQNKLAELVTFKNIWPEETGGVIATDCYTVSVPNGYTPKIGPVTLTIAGNHEKYYAGSRTITVTVTGDLDTDLTRVEIGDNDIVSWEGVAVTPGAVRVLVYNGNKLLNGGYIENGASIPADWDYTVTFTNNNSVGLATATITGVNKYSGTVTKTFKITCPMNDLTVQLQDSNGSWVSAGAIVHTYPYKIDTNRNKPLVKLYYSMKDGSLRELAKDFYAVTYNGYENAGNANIIISESTIEDYQGILLGTNRVINYTLEQISIDTVSIEMTNPNPMYTGNEMTAADIGLELSYGGYVLGSTDYTLSFKDAVNTTAVSGKSPRIIIFGQGNFSGMVEKTFQIMSIPITSDTDISSSADNIIYTGNAVAPKVTINQVTGNSRILKENVDYKIVGYLNDTKSIQQEQPFAEIGSYFVKVEGLGNYSALPGQYREIPYQIVTREMTDGIDISFVSTTDIPVVNGAPQCTYNGKAHEPGIKVIYNNRVLNGPDTANPEYEIVYSDNIDAGAKATATITGIGSFSGTRTVSFEIQPKDILGVDILFNDNEGKVFQDEAVYKWEQKSIQPLISIKDTSLNVILDQGETDDYVVTYYDENDDGNTQTNAGAVTMTITGKGNYTGIKQFTYYIGEDISKAYTLINGQSSKAVEYNGLVQAPADNEISVVGAPGMPDLINPNGEKRYDIAYYKDGFSKANQVTRDQIVNAGTYYVAVIGVPSKGTFAKSDRNNSCSFTITPRSIAPSYILVSGFDGTYYYTGQPIQPKGILVEDTDLPVTTDVNDPLRRSVKLTNGIDYSLSYTNNISAGKASIVVTGNGNYTGSRVAYFNIVSSNASGNNTWDGSSEGTGSISDGTTTISASDIILGYDNSSNDCMMYNGYARIPTVTIAGKNNNDFIITASNNIQPGIATLMITGRGTNFTGTIIKTYKIKADLSAYGSIVNIADQVYSGYQITPSVTLTCGGNLLNPGKDYTVTYLNNVNVGRATVMVTATSDSYYTGTATGYFNISNTAGGMEISGYGSAYTYTGYPIAPDVVVSMNGRVLNRGTDYTVTYSNNTNVGTASLTVRGIGSYSGTKTITYAIEAKNIENCLTTSVTNYQYTGNTYTPSVTITDSSNGKTLVAGTDYTITYSNNTNPGTASITVTALSKNYTGSKVIPFKITSAAVSGLRTSAIKNNSVKLAWSKQEYADGYQICNSNNRVVATTNKNSYTISGLNSCTTYKFKVRSYVENADGSVSYGNFSTAVSAKTLLNTPKLTAKSTSKGKVTLTWTKVSKASGYEIFYSTKKDGIYTRLKTISKASTRKYVDSGLASGEKYYYTIRAYRTANGVKTYSNYNTIKSVKVK